MDLAIFLFAVAVTLFVLTFDVRYIRNERRARRERNAELVLIKRELREMREMVTECVTYIREQNMEMIRSQEIEEEDRNGGLPPYTRTASGGPAIMPMLEQIGLARSC